MRSVPATRKLPHLTLPPAVTAAALQHQTAVANYRHILVIPSAAGQPVSGRHFGGSLNSVKKADLVIGKNGKILKDRYGPDGRVATIGELFAATETIYATKL